LAVATWSWPGDLDDVQHDLAEDVGGVGCVSGEAEGVHVRTGACRGVEALDPSPTAE
jgi:hypothetical protein